MKTDTDLSDELLNAFVDDQLETAERGRVMAQVNADPALEARVCDAWRVKEMVQHAYRDVRAPSPGRKLRRRWFDRSKHALAAGLLLVAGLVMGWFGHGAADDGRIRAYRLAAADATQNKVVLHLASGDPARLRGVLDDAEYLLSRAPGDNRPVALEIVANEGGLALLRADLSPFGERIRIMNAAHPELRFVACRQGLEKLRDAGVQVQLLPGAEITPSAMDQITARLREGWLYVRV